MSISDMRRGRFKLAVPLIGSNPADVRRIMGYMIVLRAECLVIEDAFEYYAISPLFRELDSGEVIPEYQITFDANKSEVFATEI